jgi:hypothetical protein
LAFPLAASPASISDGIRKKATTEKENTAYRFCIAGSRSPNDKVIGIANRTKPQKEKKDIFEIVSYLFIRLVSLTSAKSAMLSLFFISQPLCFFFFY